MSLLEDLSLTVSSALDENGFLPCLGGDLCVFDGQFSLKSEGKECLILGSIFYSFCEKVELLFKGKLLDPFSFEWGESNVGLIASDLLSGNAFIQEMQGDNITGFVTVLENKQSSSCDSFRWFYLNAPKVFGDEVRRGNWISRDRLVFRDGSFQVIFENVAGYKEQKRHRQISHYCELRNLDGIPITVEDALEEIRLFSRFVSFFAGCRHAPFFIKGLVGNDIRYEFHSIAPDSSLVGVSSWRPDFKDKDLISLWPKFRAKSFESLDQYDVLNTVIHWYLAANMNDGLLEGAYILGFAGIQLLSAEIAGEGLKNNEIIDDFISRLHLDVQMDADDISRMRNWLAHYEVKNRTAYQGLSFEEKYARLEVVLQVLELAILYWLGYEGHFCNRRGAKWQGRAIELVPWLPMVNE